MKSFKQKCLLVLGMHRSGTSALTGFLHQCGVYLGETMEPLPDNEKGFFENFKLHQFNEKILAKNHVTWSDFIYNINFEDEDVDKLKSLFIEQFSDQKLFAIKDPRIIHLFPLYVKALNALNIEINIILPFRHPLEIAKSLAKRNSFNEFKGVSLAIYNFLLAEKHSRHYKRCLVKFNDLVTNPSLTFSKIREQFNIEIKENDKSAKFIDVKLKHHTIDTEAKEYDELQLPQLIAQLDHFDEASQILLFNQVLENFMDKIKFMDKLGVTHHAFLHTAVYLHIDEIKNRLETHAALSAQPMQASTIHMQEVNRIQKQFYNAQNEIKALTNSLSWRITKPLRQIFRLVPAKLKQLYRRI